MFSLIYSTLFQLWRLLKYIDDEDFFKADMDLFTLGVNYQTEDPKFTVVGS